MEIIAHIKQKNFMLFPLNQFCDFSKEQNDIIRDIKADNAEELKSWTLFAVKLPLLTFIFAAIINSLLSNYFIDEWSKFLNNGSLPIISFGIVSSALSYLVDKLSGNNDIIFELRKRVTAVSLILLFVTSSLFILQSSSFVIIPSVVHVIILLVSVFFTIYSVQLGKLMFVLQSSFANAYIKKQERTVEDTQRGLSDEFGDVI